MATNLMLKKMWKGLAVTLWLSGSDIPEWRESRTKDAE